MNRWLCAPLLVSVTACNLSQELEGPKPPHDSGPPETSTDAGAGDALPMPKDSGPTDGGAAESSTGDAPPGRPETICTPKAAKGTAAVLVDGTQGYVNNVDDIAIGTSDVYAFSSPFGLYGVPVGGGPVTDLSLGATLPSLIAGAIAPPGSALGGSMSGTAVLTADLPSGAGTFLGLLGPSFGELTVTRGQIAVDGTDVFYWSPSELVQASLAGKPDRIVASYTSTPSVTAMGFDATYLYFGASDGGLYRTLRSGGPIDTLAKLVQPVDSILVSGTTLYLATQRVAGLGRADFELSTFDVSTKTTTAEAVLPLVTARTTPVMFDGLAFYWGASSGEAACGGELVRLTLPELASQGPSETLVSHLDVPLVVRLAKGGAYVGTSGDATYREPLTGGQLVEWSP